MKQSIIILTVLTLITLLSTSATAAPMLRVVGVTDSHTIVVDRNGVAASIRLAGINVNPADEAAAIDFLRTKLVGAWVLVETAAGDSAYVYRSPDGLFVNGELTRGAWTESTTKMTYLGESYAAPQKAAAKPASMEPREQILPPAKPHRARTSPKGATRIPKLPTSQR